MADKISEYYEVTVKCQEETGYNQKKQEPIYKKFQRHILFMQDLLKMHPKLLRRKWKHALGNGESTISRNQK